MITSIKNFAFASLFLGATLLGATSANAIPLTSTIDSIQPAIMAENSDVKKTEFLLGLGIGALVGGAVVHHHDYHHDHSFFGHRHYGHRHHGRYAPWSRAWRNDCSRRYRTFNPRTGYYISRNHGRTFCR